MGLAGLEMSVKLLEKLESARILDHIQQYNGMLEAHLCDRGFKSARPADLARHSAILSMRPPSNLRPGAIASRLSAAGILCTSPDGWLRFAPHWPNQMDEISSVLDVIDTYLRTN